MTAERSQKHPRCPKCGYDLTGLVEESTRCPECGQRSHLNELAWGDPPAGGTVVGSVLFILVAAPLSWVVPGRLAGVTEAWDGAYWWVWLAATALCSGVAGWIGPRFWALWPPLIGFVQFMTMLMVEPVGGSLWPIGLCIMLGFGVLYLAPAALGARLRSTWDGAG